MCQEEERDFHKLGQADELNIRTPSVSGSRHEFGNKKVNKMETHQTRGHLC